MFIFDGHLDLAYNALRGRDVLAPASQQKADSDGTPSVGLPDLRRAGVGGICATIFVEPASPHTPQGYRTAQEAHDRAWQQLEWYGRVAQEGHVRLVTNASAVPAVTERSEADPPRAIVLLEGADPILSAQDAKSWFDAGVRIVALAWRATRYAGGTGQPGPLTAAGRELVRALDQLGMIHDISHLAEESFWQLLDLTPGPVMASHSNCRALVPTDRQLSDAMIRALAKRGGVIGINLYAPFLAPPEVRARRPAALADAVAHMQHICDLIGSAHHVALGSDMDGGFGRESLPEGVATSADLPRLADALSAGGFGDDDIQRTMGENWCGFFRHALPRNSPISRPAPR